MVVRKYYVGEGDAVRKGAKGQEREGIGDVSAEVKLGTGIVPIWDRENRKN